MKIRRSYSPAHIRMRNPKNLAFYCHCRIFYMQFYLFIYVVVYLLFENSFSTFLFYFQTVLRLHFDSVNYFEILFTKFCTDVMLLFNPFIAAAVYICSLYDHRLMVGVHGKHSGLPSSTIVDFMKYRFGKTSARSIVSSHFSVVAVVVS